MSCARPTPFTVARLYRSNTRAIKAPVDRRDPTFKRKGENSEAIFPRLFIAFVLTLLLGGAALWAGPGSEGCSRGLGRWGRGNQLDQDRLGASALLGWHKMANKERGGVNLRALTSALHSVQELKPGYVELQ